MSDLPGHDQFIKGLATDVVVFVVLILYPKKHGTSLTELRIFGHYTKTLRGSYIKVRVFQAIPPILSHATPSPTTK